MELEPSYFYGENFIAAGITAMIILIGLYIYITFMWMKIAKKRDYNKPWLAFIPIANFCLWLELGGFRWTLIFILIGLVAKGTILAPISAIALMAFITIAHWKVYEKLNYPGWLGLVFLLFALIFIHDSIYGFLGIIMYSIVTGIVALKER